MSNIFDQVIKRRDRAVEGVAKVTKPKAKPASEFDKIVQEFIAAGKEDTQPKVDPVKEAQRRTGPSAFRNTVTPKDTRSASQAREQNNPGSYEAMVRTGRKMLPSKMSEEDERDFRSAVWILSKETEGGPEAAKELAKRWRTDKEAVRAEVAKYKQDRPVKDLFGIAEPRIPNEIVAGQPNPIFDAYDTVMDPAMKVFNAVDPFGNLARQTGADDMLVKGGQQGVDAIDEFFKTEIGQTIGASAVNPLLGLLPNDNPIKQGAAGLAGGITMTVPEAVANYGRMVTDDPSMRPRDRVMPAAMLAATVLGAEWATYKALTRRGGQLFAKLAGKGVPEDIAKSVDSVLADVPVEKLDEFVPQEAANYDPGVVPDLKAGLDEVPPANQVVPPVKQVDEPWEIDGFIEESKINDWPKEAYLPSEILEQKRGLKAGDDAEYVVSQSADGKPKRVTVRIAAVGEHAGEPVAVVALPDGTHRIVNWAEFGDLRRTEKAIDESINRTTKASPPVGGDRGGVDVGNPGAPPAKWSSGVPYNADGRAYAYDKSTGAAALEAQSNMRTSLASALAEYKRGNPAYPEAKVTRIIDQINDLIDAAQSQGFTVPPKLNYKQFGIDEAPPLRRQPLNYQGRRGPAPEGTAAVNANANDTPKVPDNAPTAPASPALAPDVPKASADAVPKAAPKVEDVPPAKPPKAAESAVPDEPVKPQGVSHAEVDDLRKEMGWTPRDPAKAKPDADLAADAKKLEGDESAIADKVLGDAENKVTLGDEEAVALGKKLTSLKQRMLAAKAANDVDAFDLADAQAQKIADALDLSGTRQGRAFRARRFLFKDQEDAWTLNRRARKANQDQPLDTKQQANLDKRIKELEEANAALAKERDDAIKSLSDSRNNPRPSRNGPLTSQKRRSAALNSLRKLGITVADDTVGAASGGMKSKRSGAINIPQGSTEQVARAIRGLVRSYADTGISKWDDVLAKLKADLPGIDEEQALFILSGKYKVAKVEADLAKKAVNKFMSNVQADAVYRTKPLVKKVLHHAFELFNTGQRSLQTSLDNSLALIQGKNVLMSRPGTWMKGVGKSLQTLAKKDPLEFARRHMAEIENNPLYAKAVQAKLGLSDVDGSYSHQEEFFAGKFQDMVPGLSHSKAMATTLMNTMRWDLFRKMTANLKADAPAEAYEDIARYINVLTGKGDGKIAEWLGGKPAGIVSYAPRFYLSKVQHNIGQPIWAAKTAAGRKQVLKGYAQQMAGYGSALAAAEAFGWDVDLDPRSATFGKASKDGVSFDLFYQQSEGVRVMAQFTYGRISQKGQYKAPGDYGDYGMGDYIESKSSPLIKTAFRAATGKTYDYDEGKTRDVVASDYWGNFIPLSIQEMYKNKDIPMSPAGIATSTAASFMGGGVAKVKPKTASKKTIPPLVTDPIVKPVEDIIKGLINKK